MLKTFADDPNSWKRARRPNYEVNKKFGYPYSECPHLGEYNLLKIPRNGLVDHVDYWGEGRIKVDKIMTGFPDCYNVNHTYQLVSNGNKDTINRKIANRIPVISYTDCRTDSYIKDNSVKIVTLMGAPINKSCAKDIARIVNSDEGIVVLYDMDRNAAYVKNLDETLIPKAIICCPGYELSKKLQEPALFDQYLAFVNLSDYKEILKNTIKKAEYDNAVKMCLELATAHQEKVVVDTYEWIFNYDNQKTMTFLYKLWLGGGQDFFNYWLPPEYKNIVRSAYVSIYSQFYNRALKLDGITDRDGDRVALGDAKDFTSKRVWWTFVPEIYENRVVFKIKNYEHLMFLKLDVHPNEFGDRKCYGSTSSDERRHNWLLEPVRYNSSILFYIVNDEYQQPLKLEKWGKNKEDLIAWGDRLPYTTNPSYYRWIINPV